METRWFAPHVAYSMAKYSMSMAALGLAAEFAGRIGVTALWPRTAIDTAAMAEFKAAGDTQPLRKPTIVADAARLILTSDARSTTGNFFIDDEVLAAHGAADLSGYAPPGTRDIDLLPDFFVPSLRELRGLPNADDPDRAS